MFACKIQFLQAFCKNQRFHGILKVFGLSRTALIISMPSFGLKFRRLKYYRLGCGWVTW